MNPISNQFLSIQQIQNEYQSQNVKSSQPKKEENLSFSEILAAKSNELEEAGELKFSKHAANRLQKRNIDLTDGQLKRLAEGTSRAGEKGIKESLVLVDDLAFIVNISNHTVITAMNQGETDNHIFTNIDGAVIM
ncbi:MAG: flagellar protein [Roseburia sp.]|nr:flagellar protein [Roseburia sp.]MCM1278042.1 flagellar protein [Robinsoniella sp.]